MPLRTVRCINRNQYSQYPHAQTYNLFIEPNSKISEVISKYKIGDNEFIRCFVSNLLNKDGKIVTEINEEFNLIPYNTFMSHEHHWLYLPEELVLEYGIEEGLFLDVTLKEVINHKLFKKPRKIYGKRNVDGLIEVQPIPINKTNNVKSETLITTEFEDRYYVALILEINKAYQNRLFTATLVLIRKLFENLILDMIRLNIGKNNIELYFDKKRGMIQNFSTLILNLKENIDAYKPYTKAFHMDDEFFRFLDRLKVRCDASAHSLDIIPDPKKIESWRTSINKYTELIRNTMKRITESSS